MNAFSAIRLSGQQLLNGISHLTFGGSGIAFTNDLYQTGVFIENQIISLSGNLLSTGSNLQNQITTQTNIPRVTGIVMAGSTQVLTGLITFAGGTDIQIGEGPGTITIVSTAATVANLFSTGSILLNDINLISGNLTNSGVSLLNTINGLSGALNNTGAHLYSLIGNVTGLQTGAVLIYGAQLISGQKTFNDNIIALSDVDITGNISLNGVLSGRNGGNVNNIYVDNITSGPSSIHVAGNSIYDDASTLSIDWGNHNLFSAVQNLALDWNDLILSGNWTLTSGYIDGGSSNNLTSAIKFLNDGNRHMTVGLSGGNFLLADTTDTRFNIWGNNPIINLLIDINGNLSVLGNVTGQTGVFNVGSFGGIQSSSLSITGNARPTWLNIGLATTGDLNGLSGQLNSSGAYLYSLINASSAGVSSLNALSGALNIIGSGNLQVISAGQNIYLGVTGIAGNSGGSVTLPSNLITGSGIINYIPRFAGSTGLTTGILFFDSSNNVQFAKGGTYTIGSFNGSNNPASIWLTGPCTSSSTQWNNMGAIFPTSDGVVEITNNGGNDFGRLMFGGTSASFPAISKSGNSFQLRVADNSNLTNLGLLNLLVNSGGFDPSSKGVIAIRTGTAPTVLQTGNIQIYSSGAPGNTNLFALDDAGRLTQLTNVTVSTGNLYPSYNPNNYCTSGNLYGSGVLIENQFASLSGNLLSTGANLLTQINQVNTNSGNFTNLFYGVNNLNNYCNSGNLTNTGLIIINDINSLSGSLLSSGSYLYSLISASSAGVSSINLLSGNLNLTGAGNVTIINSGQLITVSGFVDNFISGVSGVIYSNGAGDISNGQLLIGNSGDNSFAQGNLYGFSGITVISGSGSLGLSVDSTIATYANLTSTGTNILNQIISLSGNLLNSGENLQNQINSISEGGAGITGISITGGHAVTGLLNFSAGTNITLTQLGNTGVNISAAGGGSSFTWNTVTGDTTMSVNNGYITNCPTGIVHLLLPSTTNIGSEIKITSQSLSGWQVTQNSGNIIYFGNMQTSIGTAGFLQNTANRDSISLVCVDLNSGWNIISSIGTIIIN